MGARYSQTFSRTAAAAATVGSFVASAATSLRRSKLYELTVGCSGAPADNIFQWIVGRVTAAGTSTPVTPTALDSADGPFLGAAGQNHTVEPTYTAGQTLLTIDLNQRATFRWVAAPYGELVYPATAANGLGIRTPVATALAVDAAAMIEEQ